MLQQLLDGRYQVLQVLGSGGFGQTYIAQDIRRPGCPKCVVKHLKPITYNPEILKTATRLFNSEAETLEQLGNHDQIPRLLAYFEENQELFLVEEFIEGHSLEAQLLPGEPWTEDQVIQLLQQLLSILEFIHRYQVIHRDINPKNIIRRQQDGKFVLIDFGAVKQIQTQLLTVPRQMENTVIIGTLGYMAIEQRRGYPYPNSDIYSLGMIGIQALTGLHPNQLESDRNTGEIIWQHQAQVSPQLAAVLSKMVLNYYEDRYQSATEVIEALQHERRYQSRTDIIKALQQLDQKHYQSATQVIKALQQIDRERYQSTTEVIKALQQLDTAIAASLQPANLSQLPQPSLSQQNLNSVLPTSGYLTISVLSSEQYNGLEKILVELVGSVASILLRQVAASALSYQQLIDNLALHLDEEQQIEFKQKAMFLLKEANSKPEIKLNKLPSEAPQPIDNNFMHQCEQVLADLIGPIASFLVQEAVKTYPQVSRLEFVKILVGKISDEPQKVLEFQQHLLAKIV